MYSWTLISLNMFVFENVSGIVQWDGCKQGLVIAARFAQGYVRWVKIC